MQPYQPNHALSARRPILGFTAAPKPATREPAYAPQHDFLMLSLHPQLNAGQPAVEAPVKRPRARAA
jgi:hypothetical protein